MIDQIIEYNKTFVAQKGCEQYLTDGIQPLVTGMQVVVVVDHNYSE